jgi:hypothetical protein
LNILIWLALAFGTAIIASLRERRRVQRRDLLRSIDVLYTTFREDYPGFTAWRRQWQQKDPEAQRMLVKWAWSEHS